MKKVKLTDWERLELRLCVPRAVSLTEVELMVKLLSVLALSAEEKTRVEWREQVVITPQGQQTIEFWNAEKAQAGTVEIEFENAEWQRLTAAAQARNNWPAVAWTLALKEKLGLG